MVNPVTYRFFPSHQRTRLADAAAALALPRIIHPDMSSEEMAALPQRMVDTGELSKTWIQNPFTGQTIRPECSPGNFTVRTINVKTYFCTYNQLGIEYRSQIIPQKSD